MRSTVATVLMLAGVAAVAQGARLRGQSSVSSVEALQVLFSQSEQYAVYDAVGVSSKGYAMAATWLNGAWVERGAVG